MSAFAPLVVSIVLLFACLTIARRYMASLGLSTSWLSVGRMLRTFIRAVAGTVKGLFRTGKALNRFVQGRRRVRRRPSRVSLGHFK